MVSLKFANDICIVCAQLKWGRQRGGRSKYKSGDHKLVSCKPTQTELDFAQIVNPCNEPGYICDLCRNDITEGNFTEKNLMYPKVMHTPDMSLMRSINQKIIS